MLILHDIPLKDFEFWCGAKTVRHLITDKEMDELEDVLSELYPNGIDETTLNDIFWFDDDFIAEYLGYKDYNEFWKDRNR